MRWKRWLSRSRSDLATERPFVVLHRESGKGYRLTVSRVADNFQLDTLLAAALVGAPDAGLIDGTPPDTAWVAAATDGDPEPAAAIEGQFDLVDAHGNHLWHEGTPAEIPMVDGVHVVVLEPPFMHRCWHTGRKFVDLPPMVRFDGPLTGTQTADWWSKVAPAKDPW